MGCLGGLFGGGLFARLFRLVRCSFGGALCRHLKVQGAHGGQGDGDALLKTVHGLFVGPHGLVVDSTGAAKGSVVAVQHLFVGTGALGR